MLLYQIFSSPSLNHQKGLIMNKMNFTVETLSGNKEINMTYERVFAIGYAGRNMEKTMEHIRELEEQLGVPAPKMIPTIFQCGNYTLTQEKDLHFLGAQTCGEVEYIIVIRDGKRYIGLGSDHTDRGLESVSVPKSKQCCAKPIASVLWDYDDVKAHWDSITLRSYQTLADGEIAYQDGTLADILPPDMIMGELNQRVGDMDNVVIYSGTVPLLNGFKYGSNFRCEMIDNKLNRSISMDYNVIVIPEEER